MFDFDTFKYKTHYNMKHSRFHFFNNDNNITVGHNWAYNLVSREWGRLRVFFILATLANIIVTIMRALLNDLQRDCSIWNCGNEAEKDERGAQRAPQRQAAVSLPSVPRRRVASPTKHSYFEPLCSAPSLWVWLATTVGHGRTASRSEDENEMTTQLRLEREGGREGGKWQMANGKLASSETPRVSDERDRHPSRDVGARATPVQSVTETS